MNSYEQKQEARRERLLARAAKLRAAAQRLTQRASQRAAMIPVGQPILIGHHSERRDRNFRNRISRAFEKAVELDNLAHAAAARADGVGRSGVSSDDPDAIAKLREQVGKLEQVQERMKAANRALRRGDDDALRAQGLSDAQICAHRFCCQPAQQQAWIAPKRHAVVASDNVQFEIAIAAREQARLRVLVGHGRQHQGARHEAKGARLTCVLRLDCKVRFNGIPDPGWRFASAVVENQLVRASARFLSCFGDWRFWHRFVSPSQ
ncbi:MAG: DUF3560 domain-containing protein [Nevskia sp.]|nr:DUF3560 domain-containing protein [Nevskia sp.]